MRTRYGTCQHGALLTEPCDDCGIVVPPKRGETVSHDTQVKQEAPQLPDWTECQSMFASGESTSLSEFIRSYEPVSSTNPFKRDDKEWRAALSALLATVRKEAFKEIRERVEAVNPNLTFGSANGSMMKKCILTEIAALEASATEKEEMNG